MRLEYDFSKPDLCALMSRDADGFVRWDAAQALATRVIHEVEQQLRHSAPVVIEPLLVEACRGLLADASWTPAMVAAMLTLPTEDYLAELASHTGGADVDTIHNARWAVQAELARPARRNCSTPTSAWPVTGPMNPPPTRSRRAACAIPAWTTCAAPLNCNRDWPCASSRQPPT